MNQPTNDTPEQGATPKNHVTGDVRIYFPSDNARAYSWQTELRGAQFHDLRTDLLKQQYKWQNDSRNGPARYSTCGCIQEPDKRAKFAIRKRTIKITNEEVYSFARFPKRGADHSEECVCRSRRFDFSDMFGAGLGGHLNLGRTLSTDFDGLSPESDDPEFRPVRTETSHDQYGRKHNERKGQQGSPSAPSLRKLGEFLLQESGVCEWKPTFRQRRDERSFNGLIAGAIEPLQHSEAKNRYSRAIAALAPAKFVPWSFYRSETETTRSLLTSECMIAYGFISHLEPPSPTGARMMTIRSNSKIKLLVPAAVIAKASRNVQTPLNGDALPFPIWAIFVVREFSGVLKVCAMEGHRVSRNGAIPVCSNEEEKMVEFLIAKSRHFRRLLLPPFGTTYVPDFQLLDTALREYIEVAGLMDNPKYAAGIEDKEKVFGPDKVCVWDTRYSLTTFVKKYAQLFGYVLEGGRYA